MAAACRIDLRWGKKVTNYNSCRQEIMLTWTRVVPMDREKNGCEKYFG